MRNWLTGGICVVMMVFSGIAYAQQSFYSIHISSHRQQAKAEAEVKKLATKGLDVFVRHQEVQGKGKWYRVYVGKFNTKQEAAADMNRLRKMNVSKYFAIRQLTADKPKADKVTAKPVDYYLFVGFYNDLDQARKEEKRLASELSSNDYRAFITRQTVTDGVNYRVYIGTFAGKQQAEKLGAEWKKEKLLTSFYIPVPRTQDMIKGRMPVAAPAAAAAAATATAAVAVEEKKKAPEKVQKKEPVAEKKTAVDQIDDFSRFALMFKGGAFSPQKTDDFSVTIGTTTYRVSDDPAPQVGIEAVFRFNKTIGLYGSGDTVFIDGVDWYNFAAGPIVTFQSKDSVMAYLKGGAVYGDFSWDAPGKFDSSVGWEAAAGFNFLRSKFKVGVDLAYRSMSFDYKPPAGAVVTPPGNALDLSGFSVMGTISYWF